MVGVFVEGPIKLTVTGSTVDGHDFATGPSLALNGIWFEGTPAGSIPPSGSVTKSRVLDTYQAIGAIDVGRLSITNNTLIDNSTGIYLGILSTQPDMDGSKISNNTILSVPAGGYGIYLDSYYSTTTTMRNIMISKNLISAAQYDPLDTQISAIHAYTDGSPYAIMTATITGNMLINFPAARRIVNYQDHATLTISKNDAMP
jgi:hypothetical protein